MTTLDALTVRFEADADDLFAGLDEAERRIAALSGEQQVDLSLRQELETRLTVAADEAISSALNGAGERLAQAVSGHEIEFARALASAESAMAAALNAAVSKMQSAINITVPLYVDGSKLAQATLRGLKRQALTAGKQG